MRDFDVSGTYGMKKSKPVHYKVNDTWRILRHDGVEVGWYDTERLAQKDIDDCGWLL